MTLNRVQTQRAYGQESRLKVHLVLSQRRKLRQAPSHAELGKHLLWGETPYSTPGMCSNRKA